MAVFYHHVGEEMSGRDFPKTIGTINSGLRIFTFKNIQEFCEYADGEDLAETAKEIDADINGFQIWGIPAGADKIFSKISIGDIFFLMDTISSSGGMKYVGKIFYKFNSRQNKLSRFLWGEDRFPWIFFMNGEIINWNWENFKEFFKYSPRLDPRGRVCSIGADALGKSPVRNQAALYQLAVREYSASQPFQGGN